MSTPRMGSQGFAWGQKTPPFRRDPLSILDFGPCQSARYLSPDLFVVSTSTVCTLAAQFASMELPTDQALNPSAYEARGTTRIHGLLQPGKVVAPKPRRERM